MYCFYDKYFQILRSRERSSLWRTGSNSETQKPRQTHSYELQPTCAYGILKAFYDSVFTTDTNSSKSV